jgi:nucleotide-binding universal stress UspA family protein
MYKKILIPIAPNHFEAVSESIAAARTLADEDATFHAVSVINVVPDYVVTQIGSDVYERSCAEAKANLAEAFSDMDDVEFSACVGEPPSKIVATVKEGGYDLVVIRSHKPGIQDWFLGSTAGRVVRNAPCAVHVLR